MVEQPDEVVVHHAISCPCCNNKFSGAEPVTSIDQKRQVFDILKPHMEVTEHQLGMIICCGQTLYGAFPEKVSQPVQYGSRIKSLSVLLNNDNKLPLQKIEQLMRNLWGCFFNESTVVNTNAGMYDSLQVVEQEIRANILATKLAYFSEPGMRLSKHLHWFHSVFTAMSTDLFVHNRRGKDILRSEDFVLKSYIKHALYNYRKTYLNFLNSTHALCSAYLFRELNNLAENGQWVGRLNSLLHPLALRTDTPDILPEKVKQIFLKESEQICKVANAEEAQPTQNKRKKPKIRKDTICSTGLTNIFMHGFLSFFTRYSV
jgi:transposase